MTPPDDPDDYMDEADEYEIAWSGGYERAPDDPDAWLDYADEEDYGEEI